MNRTRIISLMGGTALVGAVLTGGVISASALDGGSSGGGSVAATLAALQTPEERTAAQQAYLEKLAAKLNVSVDTLTAALKATSLETLDERVAAGEIPADRADALRAGIESGEHLFFGPGLGGPGGPGGHAGRGGPGGPGGHFIGAGGEELAAFLGVDEATIRSGREAGKSLATIAGEAGTSRDELKTFLTGQASESLAQAVTDGRLSQDEAGAKLAEFTANLDAMIDGQPPAGGPHGPRMAAPPMSGAMPGATS